MTTMHLADTAQGLTIVPAEVTQPQPGPGELLISVCAAGVTPSELRWYPTTHQQSGGKRTGAVPGHEFSGVVEACGQGVGELEVRQEVFGMNDWFTDGATAAYCTAPFSSVVPKPARLTHIDAASVPIGALTAWQGLFERAQMKSGERVLVHGGAGAVGVFVVQLAKLHGAQVVATASGANLDFVAERWAEQVIDCKTSRFEEIARDFDVVFDTVGGETLERSWGVLKPNGRMVTIASGGEVSSEGRIKDAFFIGAESEAVVPNCGLAGVRRSAHGSRHCGAVLASGRRVRGQGAPARPRQSSDRSKPMNRLKDKLQDAFRELQQGTFLKAG